MWSYIGDLYGRSVSAIMGFGWTEWMITFACVVAWGAFCMRGYGSRSGY